MSTNFTHKIWIAPLLVAVLGGCVYDRATPGPVVMTPAPAPTPAVIVPATPTVSASPSVVPSDRVVYPDGRWQLYGDGRGTPYYWVWIPTGATLTSSPMPPPRPVASSVASTDRAYSFPEGRWQLYGDGRTTQYYWVWIPAGVTPPMPPMPPQAG
jgi:hypothetical protein